MKTTNFEISKKLAEIGFEAENDFYWVKWNAGLPELVYKSEIMPTLIEKVPAYDLETLINVLQKTYDKGDLTILYYKNTASISFTFISGFYKECFKKQNQSLADTAGRLIIALHQDGIINFNK